MLFKLIAIQFVFFFLRGRCEVDQLGTVSQTGCKIQVGVNLYVNHT